MNDQRPTSPVLISIIIPAYNEQSTLPHVVRKILELVPYSLEIIIVDDCSTDETNAIAKSLEVADSRVTLLCHDRNLGKTSALCTGLSRSKGDVVVIQDADLEYDPGEIRHLVQPIVDGQVDVVYGSRFLNPENAHMAYFHQNAANRFLTGAANLVHGLKITDVETGYKAFRGAIIRNTRIVSRGFGFEIEITAKIAKLGCSLREISVGYRGRTYAEGKKIGFWDFLAAVWLVIYFKFFPGT